MRKLILISRWAGLAVLLPAAAASTLAAVLLTRIWVGGIDLHVYLAAAQVGLHSGWGHIYNATLQRPLIRPYFAHIHGYSAGYWSPYVTTPPVAWLVAPLTFLPFNLAWWIWSGLAAVAVVCAALLLTPSSKFAKVMSVLVLLAMPQAGLGVVAGNVVAFLILAAAGSWRLALANRPYLAGAVLGAFAAKPQLAVLIIPVLLLGGQWRIACGAIASGAIVAIASAISLGIDGLKAWFALTKLVSSFHDQRFLSFGHLLGPTWLEVPVLALVAVAALLIAFRTRALGATVSIPVGIIGSVLVSPYLNGEDFMMLTAAGIILAQQPLSPAVRLASGVLAVAPWVVSPGSVLAPDLAGIVVLIALLLVPRRNAAQSSTFRRLATAVPDRSLALMGSSPAGE